MTPSGTDLQPLKCAVCPDNCLRCNGATPNLCTLCKVGFNLKVDGSCATSCPTGTFAEPLSRTCVATCPAGLFGVATTNTCVATCPSGFFPGDNSLCTACIGDCATCPNAVTCSACKIGFRLLPGATAANPNTCVATCPAKFFTSSTGAQCIPCLDGCASCNNALACNSCDSPKLIQFDVVKRIDTCLAACLAGFYSSQNRCLPCLEGCTSCTSPTTCITCSPGGPTTTAAGVQVTIPPRFILQITGRASACVEVCPDGFYADTTSKSCIPCFTNCDKCSAAAVCQQCKTGFFLQSGPTGANSQCLPECPAKTFKSFNGICVPCIDGCAVCSRNNVCDTCDTGRFLAFGNNGPRSLCTTTCPAGTFPDAQTNLCRRCPSECPTCDSIAQCTSCRQGLNLQLAADGVRTVCRSSCPDGTFANNQICTRCPQNGCAICDDATTCTQCNQGLFLSRQGTATSCIATVPTGQIVSSTGEILPQGSECPSCEFLPPNSTTCQACPSNVCAVIRNIRRNRLIRLNANFPCQNGAFFGFN